MKANNILILLMVVSFTACKNNNIDFDASGTFEADETIISSEVSGVIRQFNAEEGATLKQGEYIGYIDTSLLFLQKKQLQSQINAINLRVPNIEEQTDYFNQQIELNKSKLNYLLKEEHRLKNLFKSNAATQKQLDDMQEQITELKKQIEVINQQKRAQTATLQTQKAGLKADPLTLIAQIEQVNKQLKNSIIIAPFGGTIINRYVKAHEMVTMGKPMFKIADLSILFLKVYITGSQLPKVKLNQSVKVLTDNGDGGFNETIGIVTWINEKAEFTPKTIQTKEERANMVYAVKVKIVNDGSYKIGMYGQIKL